MIKIFMISLCLFCSSSLFAINNGSTDEPDKMIYTLDSSGIIESNGIIYIKAESDFNSTKTIDDGTRMVIEKAKKEILEYKGAKVTSSIFSSKLYDNLNENEIFQSTLESRAEGYITEFQIITKGKKLIAGGDYTRIIIYAKARYEKIKGDTDPQFDLSVKLNKRLFITGDPMEINMNSSQDGFITVFSFDLNGKAYPLFPNEINPDNRIKSKAAFTLPSKKEKEASASYRMFLPDGINESLESLRVIVTAEPFSTSGIQTIDDFPAKFVKMRRDRFEYVDIGYKIVNK